MRAGRRAAWRGGRGALHVLAGVGAQSGGGSGGGSRSFVHCAFIIVLNLSLFNNLLLASPATCQRGST